MIPRVCTTGDVSFDTPPVTASRVIDFFMPYQLQDTTHYYLSILSNEHGSRHHVLTDYSTVLYPPTNRRISISDSGGKEESNNQLNDDDDDAPHPMSIK
jgi:hypothetical protein